MSGAIAIVKKFFPVVTSVKDGDEPLTIEVTKHDNQSAAVRNHKACAMAVACKRKLKADGVIVSVSTAYVINGSKATRYKLPERVSREVISFDRQGGFAPGEYQLLVPTKDQRLGHVAGGNKGSHSPKKKIKHYHTSGVRTVLGSNLQ